MTQTLAGHVAAEIRAALARQTPRRTQRQLAEVLGLSQAQVSDRMRGLVEFRVSEIEATARWLGMPVTDFLPDGAR